ncbi:MAG TPA: hypothetical protein VK105_13720 [Virgibacillus sp.]|nr:hypothetical protein [Virgibacillus sp.]HLR68165.1 hypothetical protein [Virgibacillus sp.]
MDDLLELIFSNPLFLILIIGGLISLLKGGSGNKDGQQSQTQRSRQPQTVTHNPSQTKTQTQTRQQRPQTKPRERIVRTTSVEEQRQKQLEQLTGRIGVDPEDNKHTAKKTGVQSPLGSGTTVDKRRQQEIAALHHAEQRKRVKKKFRNNLSRDGLIDSVIMSEVLGPPRARKPYESVVNQRRRS